jgi:hypothetical protein
LQRLGRGGQAAIRDDAGDKVGQRVRQCRGGGPVGREVALLPGEEEAALAGFRILDQGEHPQRGKADFLGGADRGGEAPAVVDQPDQPGTGGQQRGEAGCQKPQGQAAMQGPG